MSRVYETGRCGGLGKHSPLHLHITRYFLWILSDQTPLVFCCFFFVCLLTFHIITAYADTQCIGSIKHSLAFIYGQACNVCTLFEGTVHSRWFTFQ